MANKTFNQHISKISFYLTAIALATGAIAISSAQATFLSPDYSAGELPDFSLATFDSGSSNINNPYFPLTPGNLYTFEGEIVDPDTEETEFERNQVLVTFETKEILGVTTRVVRDRAYVDEILVEDTFDWYAQDTQGNVWYLGELATNYEYDDEGNLIRTNNDGSWEAGINSALPGYIMEANPQVGDQYYQEFAPNDNAVDQGQVLAINKTISTSLGNLDNVLQTFDFTEVEPSALEYKYYAPGIGLALVDELNEEGEVLSSPQLVSMESNPQSVPEPTIPVLGLLGCGLLTRKMQRQN